MKIFKPTDYAVFRDYLRKQGKVWTCTIKEKDARVDMYYTGEQWDTSNLVAMRKHFHSGEDVAYIPK